MSTRLKFALIATSLAAAQCAQAAEPAKGLPPGQNPGDVVVEICPSGGVPCFYGRAAGDPGVPQWGNLIANEYYGKDGKPDGGRICDRGTHPVQSAEDLAELKYHGRDGVHCEANPAPPLPPPPPKPFPWIILVAGVSVLGVLLAALFAPRIWRAAKPLLRRGGWPG